MCSRWFTSSRPHENLQPQTPPLLPLPNSSFHSQSSFPGAARERREDAPILTHKLGGWVSTTRWARSSGSECHARKILLRHAPGKQTQKHKSTDRQTDRQHTQTHKHTKTRKYAHATARTTELPRCLNAQIGAFALRPRPLLTLSCAFTEEALGRRWRECRRRLGKRLRSRPCLAAIQNLTTRL